MNKIFSNILFVLLALLCFNNKVNAQNDISVEPLSLKPCATAVLKINMSNNVDICSFQLNLKLPNGINVVKELNEDNELVEAISLTSRKKPSHELIFKKTEEGSYFLLAYSLSNATFRDNDGAIVDIKITADDNLPEGEKEIIISNILLVTPSEEKIQTENITGHITISQNDNANDNNGENTEDDNTGNETSKIGDNAFYIPSTILSAGAQQTLNINLKNVNEITAFQFDLILPMGITVNTILNDDDEQIPYIQLTNRKKSRHQLSCIQQEDGSYRIVAISMNNQTFIDNDGAIVTVNVTASPTLSSGSYYAKLCNIHIVPIENGLQGERIDQSDYTTNINVTNASEGSDIGTKMYISTNTLVAGQKNQDIRIALNNNIDVTAFQFDITLPQGMDVANYLNDDEETVPNVQLTTRNENSHSISCNYRGDGRYTVVVMSMKSQAISENFGDVVSIKVNVPLTMSGNQNVILSSIHIVPLVNGSQGIRIDQPDVTHNIYVKNESSGDIPNGVNTITAVPLSLCPGDIGVLNINMNNEDDICSFQFNIKLPDGISISKEYNEDEEYVESINLTSRKKSSHELSFKQTEDGGYFLIVYSLNNSTFRDNNGAIVSIKVKADENMSEGNYDVVISNILMVTPDERKIEQEDYCETLTITSENGVEDVSSDNKIKISLIGTTVIIEGLSQYEKAEIYSISGYLLTSAYGNGQTTTIDCSAYKDQTIIVRAIGNKKDTKSIKFNL